MLELPETAPSNMLIFLQRATLFGSQAKRLRAIVEKIQNATALREH